MKKLIIIISFVLMTGIFFLAGFGCFSTLIIARNATCKININESFIQSNCSLGNGVYFEQLQIIEQDSLGLPKKYFATIRFNCYNPGTSNKSDYWPDKLYFNKKNKHYKWGIDAEKILYERSGKNLSAIGIDSASNNTYTRSVTRMTFGKKNFETSPVEFEKNTWYYINIYSEKVSAIYLYVDEKRNFKVFKMDSGISPI